MKSKQFTTILKKYIYIISIYSFQITSSIPGLVQQQKKQAMLKVEEKLRASLSRRYFISHASKGVFWWFNLQLICPQHVVHGVEAPLDASRFRCLRDSAHKKKNQNHEMLTDTLCCRLQKAAEHKKNGRIRNTPPEMQLGVVFSSIHVVLHQISAPSDVWLRSHIQRTPGRFTIMNAWCGAALNSAYKITPFFLCAPAGVYQTR